MRNYRRYSPGMGRVARRSHGGPPDRSRFVVGVILVVLILLFFAYLKAGKKVAPTNTSNTQRAVNSTVPSQRTSALTTAACPLVLDRANTAEKIITLTFDVGTVPGDVAKTVSALQAAGVPAAFFVTGKLVENDRAAVENIRNAGFPLYNHSYDNLRFSTLTAKEVQAQLQATEDLLRGVTNVTTKPYARLPFGDSTPETVDAMRSAGYCALTWTVDGLDISSTATVESVTRRVQTYVKPGGIILLHGGSDIAYLAIPKVISTLQADGYRFVSLDDLFRSALKTNVVNVNTTTNVAP